MQRLHLWYRPLLSGYQSFTWREPTDFGFDNVQRGYAFQCFIRHVCRSSRMLIMDFSSGMRHARRFSDVPGLIQRVVSAVRIGLKHASVPGEMSLRVFPLPVR